MDWLSDIKAVTSVVALIISVLALLISRRNSNTANQALRISRAQEERRLRKLAGNLVDALYDVDKEHIHYAISVTVRNPSDGSNAISAFELWIKYHVGAYRLVVKVSQHPGFADERTVTTHDNALTTPLKIEPGNTVKGWIGFKVPRDVVQPSSIDGYRLAIVDTHEAETFVDFALVRKTVFEVRYKR